MARSNWMKSTLGILVTLKTGKLDVNAGAEDGQFPFFTCSRETYKIDISAFSGKSVIVAGNGDLNVKYYDGDFNAYQRTYVLQVVDESVLNPVFLFHFMDRYIETLRSSTQGSTIQYLKKAQFTEAIIFLPPLKEQKRIVDLVSSVDSYIDSLQQQVDTTRTARNAVLHEFLSTSSENWTRTTLDELVESGVVVLGRGNVISKKEMELNPGPYPVYSSAQNNDGRIGSYAEFMFDEELITWSIDGGGHVFYRPQHKFSVTNIGGYLRILDGSKFLYPFLAAVLQRLHGQHVFDWQNKAHPSVLRKLYNDIPVVPIEEQRVIVETVSSMDDVIRSAEQALNQAKKFRSGLLSDLLSGNHAIPESYDEIMGAA